MGFRGFLIAPMMIELYRLDRSSTPYDADLREPKRVATADGRGKSARVEKDPILLTVQVEQVSFERLQMIAAGDLAVSAVGFVAHFQDLEADGLVDDAGAPLIAKGDRVSRILTPDGVTETEYRNPPGCFVHEVRPVGIGLGGRKNLLLLECVSRNQGK